MFMNLDLPFLLLLTIFQCSSGVFCESSGRGGAPIIDVTKLTTNAARMRAGFPPLKPRNLIIPSRIQARAQNPSPSTISPNPVTGYIQVNRANDSMLEGYVSKSCNTTSWLGVTHDNNKRMSITFTPVNPFNIAINNPRGPYKFLGFAGDNLTGNLSNYMVETNPTSPGNRPSPVGNGLNSTAIPNSESAIWSYDSQHRLTPQWTNSDDHSTSTFLWFCSPLDALAIVANPAEQPSNSYQVYFTVVFS